MKQKAKTYGMIAGAAAILAMILTITMAVISYSRMKTAIGSDYSVSFIQYVSLRSFFAWGFVILFGVGLMIDNLLVSQIARGGTMLMVLISFVMQLMRMMSGYGSPITLIDAILSAIIAALMLTAVFLPGKTGQLMCFLAMGAYLIDAVISFIWGGGLRAMPLFFVLRLAFIAASLVMYLFAALYLGEKQKAPAPVYDGAPVYAGPAQPPVDNRSPLEKLAWLQDMMARGYMGQQEYEEKKNEILDVDIPVSDKLAWYENLMQKGYLTQQEYNDRRAALLNYAGK